MNLDKKQKTILKLLSVFVLIICLISAIIFFNQNSFAKKGEFIVPEAELNTISGKPTFIKKECMYQEAKVNNEFIIYLCAMPSFKDKKLNINFTSLASNKGLIKFKVLDSKNTFLGESGLINPNSYLESISLNRQLTDHERITIRVMHYEKETYYSLGEIKLDLFVKEEI